MALTENQARMLTAWDDAVIALAKHKALGAPLVLEEGQLRQKVFNEFIPDGAAGPEGTTSIDLGDGWFLKVINKINRAIDEAALADVLDNITYRQRHLLVKFKPSLVLSVYRKLSKADKDILEAAIISSQATPSVTIVPPKKEDT